MTLAAPHGRRGDSGRSHGDDHVHGAGRGRRARRPPEDRGRPEVRPAGRPGWPGQPLDDARRGSRVLTESRDAALVPHGSPVRRVEGLISQSDGFNDVAGSEQIWPRMRDLLMVVDRPEGSKGFRRAPTTSARVLCVRSRAPRAEIHRRERSPTQIDAARRAIKNPNRIAADVRPEDPRTRPRCVADDQCAMDIGAPGRVCHLERCLKPPRQFAICDRRAKDQQSADGGRPGEESPEVGGW